MSPSSCLCWVLYPASVACAPGHATGPAGCSLTAGTTTTSTGVSSAPVGSPTTAVAQPYTEEAWAAWSAAAEAFQRAVTAEAEATGEGRAKLGQAAKRAVLHPEPTGE